MANRDIVTPNYVLNGVSSRRWIKPVLSNDLSITGSGDFSCSADYCLSGSCATNYCSVTGCPSVTRAFYNLSEDGEVYLTTSNGVIYYLANDSKEMRQIYPLRKIETTPDSVVVGGEDVTVDPNSNVTFVIPSRTHIIPWRPGTTNCNISVGEHYMDRSFVLMTRDQMTFPTSNGYFCVQVDYNRCVVFYKGELIYDGEYNGMGLPLSFSYGLERCVYGGSLGCCPKPTSSINWEYRVMPKWREEDGKFVFESAVDRFLKGVKIYERSKVIGSNLFEWDAKSSKFVSFGKYFADDSYQKIVKEVDESYEKIVRDESGMPVYENGKIKKETKTRKVLKEVDFADEFPGYRRFDVYRIDADYVNGLDPYALCWFAVPLSEVESGGTTFLRGTIGDSATQSYAREIDKLLEIIDQIKGMDAESFFDLVSFKGDFSYLSLISKIKHFADTLKLGLTHIAELLSQVERLIKGAGDLKETYEWIKGYIAAKNSEINEDINDYKTFVSKLFARDREGGVRIWWSPTIGTGKENEADEQEAKVFCGLRDEEKQAVPVFGCESELLYRCWEQLKLRHCTENEFGLSPKFLKWYSGTGYSEAEGNDILALPDNLDEVMNEFNKMNDNPTTQEEKAEETEEGSESGNQDSHKSSGHQTMWLSRWRNELCVYCSEENSTNEDGSPPCRCIDTSLASNPYTTNNNCKWTNQSNNPGVCGKCNYPVTFEEGDEEPCWTHVPDIPELDEDGNPVLDEEGNPKYRNCISYRLDNDGNYNVESGHFTHYCSVAVAKVALDYLGGRVESVLYEDGSLSDWGFIRIGASDCRVKKDYTVVGQIDGPFDLPGYVPHLVDKDGTRIVSGEGTVDIDDVDVAYTTNPVSANAVILRAPSSIDGDKEIGCVPGFAEGEGEIVYVMSDKTVEQTQRFRFYHIGDENWDGKKVTLPTKSDIKKSKTGINDGYCVDYYVTSTKFTSKTSSNRIETIKELTTTVHSTAKTFYYTVESVKNAATTKETEDGQTVNINSSTQKLRLGGGENNRLYKVLYEKDSEDGKPKKYTIKDTSDVGKWFVIKAQAVELDVVNSSKLNVPNAVDFTNFTGVEGDSGSQGKIALSKVDTSNFESTGEEFKSLVLYDVESDFEKEFSADWDDEPSYKRESLTSTSSVSYSSSDENTQSGFGNLCCVGTVNITHKYTLAESNVNADGSNSGVKDKSEKISHHTDTYTITRYLYGASANVVENQDETEQSNSSGAKYYYWVEEYASRTLVSRRVLAVENENNDSTLLEKLAAVCDKFEGASKSDIIRYLKYVPIVAATSALTETGLSSLCEKIDAAQNAYPESMKKGKVDPREVRVEFMRFFPAYITRPDYSPSLNDGVIAGNYFWIGKSEDARCAENVGIPSTSSSSDCKKNVISSPVNIADCFYNFESDRQPNETTILSAYSSYKFKGFVNNWLILKDKMEEEVRAYLEEHLHEEMEIAKRKKIKEKEEAKKEAIYKQKVEAKIKQKIQAGEIDDFFSDYDDSYLTDEEKAIIRSSIRREDYELTEEEKNACVVTVRDLDFDLDEEVRAQISALFERPEKIIWYAKWEYSYDRDVEVVDESNTGTTTKKEKTEEILYIPIPSPAGTCFPYLVGDAVINEDQFDSAGNLASTKKVKIVKGYSVDSKGNVNAELEEYQITKKDVGSWFCFGPCVDYESGLKNYGGVEKVIDNNTQVDGDVDVSVISDVDDNPYEETSGIKWIQAVNNWGDPHGIAIRGGTKVGDVYYKLGKLETKDNSTDSVQTSYSLADLTPIVTAIQHKKGQEIYITEHKKDDEEEKVKYTYLEDLDVDSDKYWYWNGYEWVKGGTYFSDAGGEQVIFYKDKGSLNIAVGGSGEQCLDDADVVGGESTDSNTDPKCAIGSRWDKTLNRNINGKANDPNDLHCNDFSKAIFKGRVRNKLACGDILAVNLNAGKEFHKAIFIKEQPIWDQPGYTSESYPKQTELLRCLGSSYTALTYNVGENRQCFRLWYHSYGKGEDASSTVSFMREFTYDSVPDISVSAIKSFTVFPNTVKKYGADKVEKTYITLLSRDRKTLYVFYKGTLVKEYDYARDVEIPEYKKCTKENYPSPYLTQAEYYKKPEEIKAKTGDKTYDEYVHHYNLAQRLTHESFMDIGEVRSFSGIWGPIYCPVYKGELGIYNSMRDQHLAGGLIATFRSDSRPVTYTTYKGKSGVFDIYIANGGSCSVKSNVECIVYLNGAVIETIDYEWQDYFDGIARDTAKLLLKQKIKEDFYYYIGDPVGSFKRGSDYVCRDWSDRRYIESAMLSKLGELLPVTPSSETGFSSEFREATGGSIHDYSGYYRYAESFANSCLLENNDRINWFFVGDSRERQSVGAYLESQHSCLLFRKLLCTKGSGVELRLVSGVSAEGTSSSSSSVVALQFRSDFVSDSFGTMYPTDSSGKRVIVDDLLYMVGNVSVKLSSIKYSDFDITNQGLWSYVMSANLESEKIGNPRDPIAIITTDRVIYHKSEECGDDKRVIHMSFGANFADDSSMYTTGIGDPDRWKYPGGCWAHARFDSEEYVIQYNVKSEEVTFTKIDAIFGASDLVRPVFNGCTYLYFCANVTDRHSDYANIYYSVLSTAVGKDRPIVRSYGSSRGVYNWHDYVGAFAQPCEDCFCDRLTGTEKSDCYWNWMRSMANKYADHHENDIHTNRITSNIFSASLGSKSAAYSDSKQTKAPNPCNIYSTAGEASVRPINLFVNFHDINGSLGVRAVVCDGFIVYFIGRRPLWGVLVYYLAKGTFEWIPMKHLTDYNGVPYQYARLVAQDKRDYQQELSAFKVMGQALNGDTTFPEYSERNYRPYDCIIQAGCSSAFGDSFGTYASRKFSDRVLFTVATFCAEPAVVTDRTYIGTCWETKNNTRIFTKCREKGGKWYVTSDGKLTKKLCPCENLVMWPQIYSYEWPDIANNPRFKDSLRGSQPPVFLFRSKDECMQTHKTYEITSSGVRVLDGADFYVDSKGGFSSVLCPKDHARCSLYGAYESDMESYTSGNQQYYKYSYAVYWGGASLRSDDGSDVVLTYDSKTFPTTTNHKIFSKCCDNYVVLVDGRVFYRSQYLFTVDDPSKINMSCCSEAALFSYDGGQCLFIEGKPVHPFASDSSSSSHKWIKGRNYRLSCCGVDYYWIQCGSFKNKILYDSGIKNTTLGDFEDMYVVYDISQRAYDNPDKNIHDYTFPQDVDSDLNEKVLEWYRGINLGAEDTLCAAFLKRNVPLRALSSGDKVEIKYKRTKDENGNVTEEGDNVEWLDLSYEEKVYENGDVAKTIHHYRYMECPKQWSLCDRNVTFEDDYKYEGYEDANHGSYLGAMLDCVKMEQVRVVPWKRMKSIKDRECFVYYKTTLISADPRITEVCCYRYRNAKVPESDDLDKCSGIKEHIDDGVIYFADEQHAIGAYAIFGDNPFYDALAEETVKDFSWTETNPGSIESAGSKTYYEYHYAETPTVQNVLGVKKVGSEHNASGRILCDVDDYYLKRGEFNADNLISCDNENPAVYDSASSGSLYGAGKMFCNLKGITKEAQKNICMIVWSRDVCQTSYVHDISSGNYYEKQWSDWHRNDEPFDELWDGKTDDSEDEFIKSLHIPSGSGSRDEWIRRLRSDVIYINDYNAAGRWDRVSGDDPVDDWQGASRGEFKVDGGYWMSAPEFYPVKDAYNDNLNPCGKSRLVVSGNNTLYVFDVNGRTDYNLFNGERREYPVIEKKG